MLVETSEKDFGRTSAELLPKCDRSRRRNEAMKLSLRPAQNAPAKRNFQVCRFD